MSVEPIEWRCFACEQLVADKDGYLHVSVGAASRAAARWRAYEAHHPRGGLQTLSLAMAQVPSLASWQVHHRSCDATPETFDYWIGAERARSCAALLDWTLHLSEKTWISGTDWSDFLRSALTGRLVGV